MKRHNATQFDLPCLADAFNLSAETALDGDRLAREAETRDRDRADSAKRQPPLLPPEPPAAARQ